MNPRNFFAELKRRNVYKVAYAVDGTPAMNSKKIALHKAWRQLNSCRT